MQELLERLAQTIQNYELILPGQKVLVAISGGPDSVFLAGALHRLGYAIGLAHVNYHLRGQDSENEELLIRQYARQWNVPAFICHATPKQHALKHHVSLQVACRDIRYDWFDQVLTTENYDCCATAHHLNDQSESILMSLVKGNSESVIHGIPIKRGPYIRPLTEISKIEILAAINETGWAYSLDYTNEKNDYTRNQFRNQIIPYLKNINPDLENQLKNRLKWYQQQHAFIRKIIEQHRKELITISEEVISLDWGPFENKFGREHLPVLLAEVVAEWGLHGHEIEQCIRLIDSQPGKRMETKSARLTRTRSGLLFQVKPGQVEAATPLKLENFPQSETIHFDGREVSFTTETLSPAAEVFIQGKYLLDIEKIHFPVTIRHWQQGDRMKPLGMKGHKKLSDIFIDEKFDPLAKARAIVLEDQRGVIFLSEYRISDRIKLTPESRKIGRIVIID
ncbi:MAG: tRNA lysidine(34) synthetase TilS [Bacteroidia bacterium]